MGGGSKELSLFSLGIYFVVFYFAKSRNLSNKDRDFLVFWSYSGSQKLHLLSRVFLSSLEFLILGNFYEMNMVRNECTRALRNLP